MKIFLLVSILIILFIILISYLIYKRPFLSTIADYYFRFTVFNKMFKKGTFEEFVNKRIEKPVNKFPNVIIKSEIIKKEVKEKEVYELKSNNKYDKIILYVHGGGFIDEITKYHVKFLDKISKKTNSKIVIPCYDLMMNGNYTGAMALLSEVYLNIINEGKQIILMGDSAGGGLVLAFSQYIERMGYKEANKMILLSPWVDLSLSNPKISNYLKKDPVLAPYGLLKSAKKWANGLELNDPLISPLFGSFKGLPKTLLIAGDAEIFYPDMLELKNKFNEENIELLFVVGKNQHHIYPLYPLWDILGIKREINEFINN